MAALQNRVRNVKRLKLAQQNTVELAATAPNGAPTPELATKEVPDL